MNESKFLFNQNKVSPKLGNIIVFLAKHIPNLSLTRLLKLLYIIDEKSIEETGIPQTWLEYKVWKMGPVAYDIYSDIKNECLYLSDYIKVNNIKNSNGSLHKITPIKDFDDSEFSNNDLELLNRIIQKYGKFNSTQLIELLHRENSLWHNIYVKENLEHKFKTENTSNFIIDLTEKIKNDDYKMFAYINSKEAQEF